MTKSCWMMRPEAIISKTNSFSASHLASKVTFWEEWFPVQSANQSDKIYAGNICFLENNLTPTKHQYISDLLSFGYFCLLSKLSSRLASPWWAWGEQSSMRSQVVQTCLKHQHLNVHQYLCTCLKHVSTQGCKLQCLISTFLLRERPFLGGSVRSVQNVSCLKKHNSTERERHWCQVMTDNAASCNISIGVWT